MTTAIEYLPDEIFMDVFEYIPMHNLHKSFFGLNRRINSILGCIQNRLSFRWMRPDQDGSPCIPFFASRITKLTVRHNHPLNLIRFPNVRCLELEQPTMGQCNEIQPHIISHLKHLRINNSNTRRKADAFEQLCYLIFSGAFTHLETCILNNIQYNHQWSTSPCALRSLQIDVQNCQSLSHLFDACPTLNRLKVMLDDQSFNFPHRIAYNSIRRLELYLRISQWSCDELELLLVFMPNLQFLSIQTPFAQRSNMVVESLANILTRCTPKLRYFFINTMVNNSLPVNNIRQLHSLFQHVCVNQSLTCRAEHITITSKIKR